MALVKKNTCDATKDMVIYIENHYSSEMFFLGNPGGTEEDDGVLVTIVFDGELKKSYLMIGCWGRTPLTGDPRIKFGPGIRGPLVGVTFEDVGRMDG